MPVHRHAGTAVRLVPSRRSRFRGIFPGVHRSGTHRDFCNHSHSRFCAAHSDCFLRKNELEILLDTGPAGAGAAPRGNDRHLILKRVAARHLSAPATPSIAVMPFVDTSPGKTQEYFSDGLAEELLSELAKTPGLRVAARTSSFQFKSQDADLRTIGQKLNVATVLEGSVSTDGNRVRIAADLINVENGFQLWSGSYERNLNNVFAVQDEIAHSVASELKVKLLSNGAPAAVARSMNSDAYSDYLQGRFFYERRTESDLEKAASYFEQAIKLDPTYARAWSGLAWARMSQADSAYGVSFEQGYRLAREAAEKALQLGP